MQLPPPHARFQNSSVLVVGDDGPWTRAIQSRMGDEGARFVDHGRASLARHNPTSDEDWSALCGTIDESDGHLDTVVVVSDPLRHGLAEDADADEWQHDLDDALTPTYLALRHAVPLLRAGEEQGGRRGGSLVVVAPVWACAAVEGAPAAHAAAGALVALVRNAAVSYGPDGVRANVVLAGLILGGRLAAQGAPTVQAVQTDVPLGGVGSPRDLAAAVAFLASHEAAFITGVALPVDGGYLAH